MQDHTSVIDETWEERCARRQAEIAAAWEHAGEEPEPEDEDPGSEGGDPHHRHSWRKDGMCACGEVKLSQE